MEGSILESIGVEIIHIMSPVSICMLLVVLLISTLSSPTSTTTTAQIRTAANLVYLENPTDTTAVKIEGALLNAVVFVALITVVTFLIVLLYYYNFTNFLKNYMRFSAFFVLGTMGGSIFLSLIQRFSIPVDSFTCLLLLFNFTVVGVLSVFSGGIPIVLRQGYMVSLGIIVAAWFTQLPEWTTWTLLIALAVYDLVAVLAPGGPLKMLVELASSREEDLPALVYEARPTVERGGRGGSGLGLLVGGVSDSGSVELQGLNRNNGGQTQIREGDLDQTQIREGKIEQTQIREGNLDQTHIREGNLDQTQVREGEIEIISREDEETSSLLMPNLRGSELSGSDGFDRNNRQFGHGQQSEIVAEEERSPLVEMLDGRGGGGGGNGGGGDGGSGEVIASRGIKLGLGDFVFYSVLVGRAAMYDLMTVYACYLAIISGLGCTLILLAVCRHALPALPISIMLGVMFYFLTRLLMEPFVVGTSSHLLMF